MKKYIKIIVVSVCLFIFGIISFKVINDNILVSDNIIYNFISSNVISDEVTPIVKFITNMGDVLCITLITVLCMFIIKNKKINYCIIINLIISVIFNNILKNIFMRSRPIINVMVEESTYSFPSGHSMISLAFYGYLIYLIYCYVNNKRLKYLFISMFSILILFIGVSRIYLGAHYATDVIGGFCISIVYLILFIDISKKIVEY